MSNTVFVSKSSKDWAHNLDDLLERWQLRNEPKYDDKVQVEDVRKMSAEVFTAYIRVCDRKALIELKQELDIINTNIRNDISRSHKYADTNKLVGWRYSATRARKKCGAYSNAIQYELSLRIDNSKYSPHTVFYDLLFESGIVSNDILSNLMQDAKRIYSENSYADYQDKYK